jgi:DNA mismatch repair protein PMS2
MFYVNGRPCGLPQFAKVFNEVYRSYNSSQSPFIFADIQLDTHLYDVNVSPDKRTILLHDQGQMLDNLRESLVELFEKQDVTVPSSQLLTGKQTPFKKPAVSGQGTPASDRSGSARASSFQQSSLALEENQQMDSEPAGTGGSEDEDGLSDKEAGNVRLRVTHRNARRATSKSSAADTSAASLMSRWIEGKTDGRESTESRIPAKALEKSTHQTAGGQQSITFAFRRDREEASQASESEEASQTDDEYAEEPSAHLPVTDAVEEERTSNEVPDEEQGVERHESPIPAILRPTQPRPTLPPSTRSPKRPGQQVATIRIGDQTITSVIGAPAKRQKTDSRPGSAAGPSARKLGTRPSVPLPSFGGRLTQMFAAAGASQAPSTEDRDLEGGEDSGHDEDQIEGERAAKGEENDAEEEEDEPLFVPQDGQESPPASNKEQQLEQGDILPSDELGSEPGEEEPEDADVAEEGAADDDRLSEPGSDSLLGPDPDGDYVDEDQNPAQEDDQAEVIEAVPAEPSEDALRRQQMLLKGGVKPKDSTIQYVQSLRTNEKSIRQQMQAWRASLASFSPKLDLNSDSTGLLDADDAEAQLSLKISKSDFAKMKIVGQFNLGFIIAVREAEPPLPSEDASSSHLQDDEVFIIDQHASDEKFNFERLQATTVVQSQRLVQPRTLDLTAMEEEIVMENVAALETNGFNVRVVDSADVGSRIQLLSLPLSRETTFSLADLEELIFLLGDNPSSSATTVPRPGRVRKMFAMRACRSSIMVGKALSRKQMGTVVRHMGEMEKPWNCPHGRPTMRHLCGLGAWDGRGWREGEESGGRIGLRWLRGRM